MTRRRTALPAFVAGALDRVLASADAHGEADDPDHTVGDLADFVRLLAKEAGSAAVLRACARYWEGHDDWTQGDAS